MAERNQSSSEETFTSSPSGSNEPSLSTFNSPSRSDEPSFSTFISYSSSGSDEPSPSTFNYSPFGSDEPMASTFNDSLLGSDEPMPSTFNDSLFGSDEPTSTDEPSSGEVSMVITNSALFDCPVCRRQLWKTIYQCENGHIACYPCCLNLDFKCPSCPLPIGFIRNRGMEKLMESIKVDCGNKKYGCKETMINSKKIDHMKICDFTPCVCPIPACAFAESSKNLYDHVKKKHSSSVTTFTYDEDFYVRVRPSTKYVICQEENAGVIFIINHDILSHGRVLDINCIGQRRLSLANTAFDYQLTLTEMGTCFSMKDSPEVCTKWEQHTPNKNFLTIPSRIAHNLVQVCINKHLPMKRRKITTVS